MDYLVLYIFFTYKFSGFVLKKSNNCYNFVACKVSLRCDLIFSVRNVKPLSEWSYSSLCLIPSTLEYSIILLFS